MNVKGLGWKLLCSVFVAALLASGTWVKASDAADLTHHEVTLKDEMGKPLAGVKCAIHDKEGKLLSSGVTSKKGLFSF